jgi:hypothetical protein
VSILEKHRVELKPEIKDELTRTAPRGEGPHLFDLNVDWPISISDQMERGYEAVNEAFSRGIIGRNKPLLVIGAGVAGMTAAMTAVKRGVETVVLEKKWVLSVQGNCPTRFVCPTQYSWPDDGWERGVFPLNDQAMPFRWKRGFAGAFADAMVRDEIMAFIRLHRPRIKVIAAEYVGYKIDSATRRIIPELNVSGGRYPALPAFAMALSCAGFGVEKTEVPEFKDCHPSCPCGGWRGEHQGGAGNGVQRYTGPKFWEEDKYGQDEPQLGLRTNSVPKVLISGSGDGALQDFLRIVTRYTTAGEFYAALREHLPGPVEARIRDVVTAAESRYKQLWTREEYEKQSHKSLYRCCVHSEAHLEHLRLIKELCRERRIWRGVTRALDRGVKDLRGEVRVKLIYPCVHFTAYYGLNRFLTLLTIAYAYQRYPDLQILHPDAMVVDVKPVREPSGELHRCMTAEGCHGSNHEVRYTFANCLTVGRVPVYEEQKVRVPGGPFNVLSVRHGIYKCKERLMKNAPTGVIASATAAR